MCERAIGNPDETARLVRRVTGRWRQVGIEYSMGGETGSTVDSHRLACWAKTLGLSQQDKLMETMFDACECPPPVVGLSLHLPVQSLFASACFVAFRRRRLFVLWPLHACSRSICRCRRRPACCVLGTSRPHHLSLLTTTTVGPMQTFPRSDFSRTLLSLSTQPIARLPPLRRPASPARRSPDHRFWTVQEKFIGSRDVLLSCAVEAGLDSAAAAAVLDDPAAHSQDVKVGAASQLAVGETVILLPPPLHLY